MTAAIVVPKRDFVIQYTTMNGEHEPLHQHYTCIIHIIYYSITTYTTTNTTDTTAHFGITCYHLPATMGEREREKKKPNSSRNAHMRTEQPVRRARITAEIPEHHRPRLYYYYFYFRNIIIVSSVYRGRIVSTKRTHYIILHRNPRDNNNNCCGGPRVRQIVKTLIWYARVHHEQHVYCTQIMYTKHCVRIIIISTNIITRT